MQRCNEIRDYTEDAYEILWALKCAQFMNFEQSKKTEFRFLTWGNTIISNGINYRYHVPDETRWGQNVITVLLSKVANLCLIMRKLPGKSWPFPSSSLFPRLWCNQISSGAHPYQDTPPPYNPKAMEQTAQTGDFQTASQSNHFSS